MRPSRILLLVPILLAACGPATPALDSGVEGRAWLGPTCPVMQAGTECPDTPYQATLEVLDADGVVLATVQCDAEGRYRLPLLPGEYTLAPQSAPSGLPWAAPLSFRVTSGHWTELDVHYDSGIR